MSNGLGLGKVKYSSGFEVIPAGTQVALVIKIRPGDIGTEGLCKRSADGKAEMLNVELTVRGGEFDKRKMWLNLTLDGVTTGHTRAGTFSRELLVGIFDAVNGLDPKDESPQTVARRNEASLAGFNGATFLAVLKVEKGKKRPDGSFWPDKNGIDRVLQVGDPNYRKLDQPPPAPIERSTPPQPQAQSQAQPPTAAAAAVIAIAKPPWAKE